MAGSESACNSRRTPDKLFCLSTSWGVVPASFASLAVGLTYYVPLFTEIPWTLSFFAVGLVAWIGGVLPALLALLLTTVGIYTLVLAPASCSSRVPKSLAQTLAFDLTALMISSCRRSV